MSTLSTRAALAKAMHEAREEGVGALYPDAGPESWDSWDGLAPSSRSVWLVAADALISSGAVIDAANLVDDEALCDRVAGRAFGDPTNSDDLDATINVLRALAVALSERGESA